MYIIAYPLLTKDHGKIIKYEVNSHLLHIALPRIYNRTAVGRRKFLYSPRHKIILTIRRTIRN